MSELLTFLDGRVVVHAGDCRDVLKTLADNSVDSVVTDPPYGINFMSKKWDDNIAFQTELWAEVLRVLKPGGYIMAFSGCRTYHRMACAIEDAGFITHPLFAYAFGSGFPKAHNLSKQLDRMAGAEREVVGIGKSGTTAIWNENGGMGDFDVTAPATAAAREWDGWFYGTQSLKPAIEPVYFGQKPFERGLNGAENVLKWNCGAINIDKCRVNIDTQDHENTNETARGETPECRDEMRGLRQDNDKVAELCRSQKMAPHLRQGVPGGKNDARWESSLERGEVGLREDGISTLEGGHSFRGGQGTYPESECQGSFGTPIDNVTNSRPSIDGDGNGPSHQWAKVGQPAGESLRVGLGEPWQGTSESNEGTGRIKGGKQDAERASRTLGRWPSNLCHDNSDEVLACFPETTSGQLLPHHSCNNKTREIYGKFSDNNPSQDFGGDSGSAARFFASFPQDDVKRIFYTSKAGVDDRLGSKHPTVKPLDLIQYLVRLITPKNGVCLDIFAGTGVTGEACFREGFSSILIEREPEYISDIQRRMSLVMDGPDTRAYASMKARNRPRDDGPLFGGSTEPIRHPRPTGVAWNKDSGLFPEQDEAVE